MKLGRRLLSYKNINLFLAVTALICCALLSVHAKAYADKDVFYIAPIISGSGNALKIASAESLSFDATVSYEIYEKAVIRFGKNQIYVDVFSTNAGYFSINNIKFANGGVWGHGAESSAVINESLAWRIFGNIDATGAELIISGKSYLVTGVVKQGKVSKEQCTAWIPIILKSDENKTASAFFIKPANYNPVDSTKNIERWINENSTSYYITDLNMYKESMEYRYKMLLLAMYACGAIWLTHKAYLLLGTKRWYFLSISVAMNLILAAAIWFNLDINMWIPKFSGTGTYQLLQAVFNWKRLPPSEYLTASVLELAKLNTYTNIAFGIGFVGMINFVFIKNHIQGIDSSDE